MPIFIYFFSLSNISIIKKYKQKNNYYFRLKKKIKKNFILPKNLPYTNSPFFLCNN